MWKILLDFWRGLGCCPVIFKQELYIRMYTGLHVCMLFPLVMEVHPIRYVLAPAGLAMRAHVCNSGRRTVSQPV